ARRLHGRHAACRADGAGPGLAAARGAVPPGCDRAHAVAHRVQSSPPAAVANLQRCRAAQQQCRRRRVATDVDRPAVRRAADRGAGVAAAAGAGAGVAAAAAVAAVARHRLVDQPAAAPARRVRAQRGADAFPARAGAADLGVLRQPRQRGGALAAAGQSAGAARPGHRASHLADYDFGFLGAGRLLERTRDTLATMRQLPRYRGHFYNWYDTQTLQPLAPLYISAVDSGNLAGHLLTLRPGLLELIDAPVFRPCVLQGLLDTLQLLHDTLDHGDKALDRLQGELQDALDSPPATTGAALAVLQRQRERAQALAGVLMPEPDSDAAFWLDALCAQLDELCAETARF